MMSTLKLHQMSTLLVKSIAILCVDKILPLLVGGLSQYLEGFIHPNCFFVHSIQFGCVLFQTLKTVASLVKPQNSCSPCKTYQKSVPPQKKKDGPLDQRVDR